MADALKEMFNRQYFAQLAQGFKAAWQPFPDKQFLQQVCAGLEPLSLNERMRHCVAVLHGILPQDYRAAVGIMETVIPHMPRGYQNLLFPEYVAHYGLQDTAFSLAALRLFTQYGSSEFAVRHFLRQDFAATIAVMETWALDADAHVRRLASEGSRPRLPWSFKLDAVLQHPAATERILTSLRRDPALYVRKSVANHLNDHSKDNVAYMLGLVSGWDLQDPHTAWIVKHACRTLIKKGDAAALALFAYEKETSLRLTDFALQSTHLQLGEALAFRFRLHSTKASPQKLVVDYAITYPKQREASSRKVFKLKELHLAPDESLEISKRQVIQDFTTRKHYQGLHGLEILVNGATLHQSEFFLTVPD